LVIVRHKGRIRRRRKKNVLILVEAFIHRGLDPLGRFHLSIHLLVAAHRCELAVTRGEPAKTNAIAFVLGGHRVAKRHRRCSELLFSIRDGHQIEHVGQTSTFRLRAFNAQAGFISRRHQSGGADLSVHGGLNGGWSTNREDHRLFADAAGRHRGGRSECFPSIGGCQAARKRFATAGCGSQVGGRFDKLFSVQLPGLRTIHGGGNDAPGLVRTAAVDTQHDGRSGDLAQACGKTAPEFPGRQAG
jgi:hypothetical protein